MKKTIQTFKLDAQGFQKTMFENPPTQKFFWHCPHPGLNQGPLDLRSNALLTEPRRQEILVKKTSVNKAITKNCVMFIIWSFFPQNFLPPWLSQQCVRPQTERSLVQSRVGAMPKKILREGIFKLGFLEPFDIKFEGLDSLLHRSGLFIQIHLGVVWLGISISLQVTFFSKKFKIVNLFDKISYITLSQNFTYIFKID